MNRLGHAVAHYTEYESVFLVQALWLLVIAKTESVVTGQAPIILERKETSEKLKTLQIANRPPLED